MELARRKDVPEELKWDLSLIYKTEEDFQADLEAAKQLADKIEQAYPGKLNDPDRIVACLTDYEELEKKLGLLSTYTSLAVSVDYYDTANLEKNERISAMYAEIASRMSFIDSEILQADDTVLDHAIDKAAGCRNYLKDLRRRKPYQLTPETEKAMAALSQSFETPYNVYNMAKIADMQFPSFTAGGKEYPLGYSLFEDDYEPAANCRMTRNMWMKTKAMRSSMTTRSTSPLAPQPLRRRRQPASACGKRKRFGPRPQSRTMKEDLT